VPASLAPVVHRGELRAGPQVVARRNLPGLFYQDAVYPLLLDALEGITVVCEWVVREISNEKFPSYTEGWCWDVWIILLANIMQEHGLPHKVSKATL
jgi:hypothetical protein